MTIMAMIDYGFIVLFFIGVASLLFITMRTSSQEATDKQALPAPKQAKGAYTLLTLLFAFLITVAFLAQKGRSRGGSL